MWRLTDLIAVFSKTANHTMLYRGSLTIYEAYYKTMQVKQEIYIRIYFQVNFTIIMANVYMLKVH